jgi:hypothetical protein
MKLSIVDRDRAEKVVPDISRFANSQNRIAAADFFSNHPFHIRMEDISRRIYAPAREGAFTQSRWFYERARGQFADRRSRLTPAQRRKFDLEHPRSQLFTKTDLAKADMTWRGKPDVVSMGAQKNFAQFAAAIGCEWDARDSKFSEEWFRNVVAKVMVFRRTEKIVSDASRRWYTGGLRAQTVCYAIAKLVHDLSTAGQAIDLRLLWKAQEVPDALAEVLDRYGEVLHRHLLSPPVGSSNPSEWAKKKVSATAAMALDIEPSADLGSILIAASEMSGRSREGRSDQVMVNRIAAQTEVVQIGSDGWVRLSNWINENGMRVTPMENGILSAATKIRLKPLSEAQAVRALRILRRAEEKGFSGLGAP